MIYLKGENPKETRLQAFRDQTKSALIDAFILTSYDDHREEMKDLSESPLMFFSGLNVSAGEAAVIKYSKFPYEIFLKKEKQFQITANSAALWIDSKYFRVADKSLSCSWKIFKSSKNTTIGLWLQVKAKSIFSLKLLIFNIKNSKNFQKNQLLVLIQAQFLMKIGLNL